MTDLQLEKNHDKSIYPCLECVNDTEKVKKMVYEIPISYETKAKTRGEQI